MNFGKFLREADGGQLYNDAETGLGEMIDAIRTNGGSGKLTISFKVTAKGIGFAFDSTLDVVTPKPPRVPTIAYLNDGELTQKDPRQPEIPGVPVLVQREPTFAEKAAATAN